MIDEPRDRPGSEERNPFATRRTRPKAVAYRFPGDASASSLIEDLARLDWHGQIIGPHGSGKSTLLAALVGELQRRTIPYWIVELHDGERHLPDDAWQVIRAPAPAAFGHRLLIVDGYEQLSRWQRWRLRAACRRGRWGRLITAHADCGLPTLARTSTNFDLALELARRLDAEVDPAVVRQAYDAHHGNLREAWFALYDLYEQRRLQGLESGPPDSDP